MYTTTGVDMHTHAHILVCASAQIEGLPVCTVPQCLFAVFWIYYVHQNTFNSFFIRYDIFRAQQLGLQNLICQKTPMLCRYFILHSLIVCTFMPYKHFCCCYLMLINCVFKSDKSYVSFNLANRHIFAIVLNHELKVNQQVSYVLVKIYICCQINESHPE